MDQKTATLPPTEQSSPKVPERRDPESRERLRLRVRSEFDECVLVLTPLAAARLFGIRHDICIRVLGELQSAGLLYASGDRYATRSLVD